MSTPVGQVVIRACVGLLALAWLSACQQDHDIPEYDALDYFNTERIRTNKIRQLELTLLLEPRDPNRKEDASTCIRYTYTFDKQGRNLTTHLNRLGGHWKNIYKGDKVVDVAYIDSETGKADFYYSEADAEKPERFKQTIESINRTLQQADYDARESERYFYDPCFSIDAAYRVTHTPDEAPLPRTAIASRIPWFANSPPKLFLYYDYQFYR